MDRSLVCWNTKFNKNLQAFGKELHWQSQWHPGR